MTATAPVALPVGDIDPTVSSDEVARAMQQFAMPAVSGPVRLDVARRAIAVAPATFTRYLSMVAQDGALVGRLDAVALKRALMAQLRGIEKPAVDATFRLSGGSPQIVASQPGMQIPPDRLASSFVAVLPRTSDRVVTVPLVTVQPAVTTQQANTLGITQQVSSFTTHYPYASYRLQNIHRAADLIDGTVLLPGQVFSLNRLVGERTAANGFAIGTIIEDGRFAKDYGGGTSQVATTTFNAAFFAGLKIITHKPHSFYISRYPAGREATVAWPDVDLQFQNDSGHALVVDTSYTSSTVTVTIWGTKVWDIASESSARSTSVRTAPCTTRRRRASRRAASRASTSTSPGSSSTARPWSGPRPSTRTTTPRRRSTATPSPGRPRRARRSRGPDRRRHPRPPRRSRLPSRAPSAGVRCRTRGRAGARSRRPAARSR